MRGGGVTDGDQARPATPERPRQLGGLRGRGRLNRLEAALLILFAAVAVWVLALDLWEVLLGGHVWTGTDGMYVTDQMQYLAWIESAAHHGLVANLFVLHGTPADYFQPAITISGLLTGLGLPVTLVLLAWKPVAVLALFYAVRALSRRALPSAGAGPQGAVIALALFYGSFSSVYGHLGVVGDLFPGFLAWGYPFALLGVACATLALLSYDRARSQERMSWVAPLLGALASSLHPWQGETLILILLATELPGLVKGAAERLPDLRAVAATPRVRQLALTVLATGVPLLYYVALDRFDASWHLGRGATKQGFPFIALGLAVAPLALIALLGYRGRAEDFLERALRWWPAAILLVYLQSSSVSASAPQHAFDGATLPLSALAVLGCRRAGWRRLPAARMTAVAALLVATVPATTYELIGARDAARPSPGNPNFIRHGEREALEFLRRSPVPGGVFTRAYLGATVPGRTGRNSFTGDCIWSQPGCLDRGHLARDVQGDALPASEIRRVLRASGARFVLSDCDDDADLTRALGPMLSSVHRFGCATVWQLS
jgi:hypothetical protein